MPTTDLCANSISFSTNVKVFVSVCVCLEWRLKVFRQCLNTEEDPSLFAPHNTLQSTVCGFSTVVSIRTHFSSIIILAQSHISHSNDEAMDVSDVNFHNLTHELTIVEENFIISVKGFGQRMLWQLFIAH